MTYTTASKSQPGFTIVEILIVIIVIAILATITALSYSAITDNARKQTAKTDAQTLATQLNKYKADKGAYPADLTPLATPSGVSSTFQYSYDATAGAYCITASVKGASAFVKSGSITAQEGGCPGHGVNGIDPITNLATNPSAETDISGVTGYNAAPPTRVSGGAVSGTYVFSTTTNSATNPQGLVHTITTSAKPGQQYTCSISLKGSGGVVAFSGRPATSTSAYITESLGAKNVTLTSSWQRLSITFTTPATTGILRVQYRNITAASGVTMQSDALLCVEGPNDYPFADGTSNNWVWNGTPHLSSSTGPAL